ncbi:MAG TPA: acyl carrier protein [Polyangium sp.]|nr:acyl carrier protein [Polyangium sp.]
MTVSVEALEAALLNFIMKEILLLDKPIGRDVDLFEAGFDSLSLSRILVFIEKNFGVTVPEEVVELDEISTVASMARFFYGYISKTNR